jgi:hypothetical protein
VRRLPRSPRFFAFTVLFLFLAGMIMAFGGKEQDSKTSSANNSKPVFFRDRNGAQRSVLPEKEPREIDGLETVRVSGRVRLVGSGFRTEIVITGTDAEWHLEQKDQEQFRNLQQRNVVVEGKLDTVEYTLANSSRRFKMLVLRNAALIKQE